MASEHWISIVAQTADILLDDTTQREALLYFLHEYVAGSMSVDALVLSLFHLMDSTQKLSLLEEIRNIIAAQDITRYDSLTSGMKTEWMMSPATLFAGISQSIAELNMIDVPQTPVSPSFPLPSISSTSALLKPSLKAPVSFAAAEQTSGESSLMTSMPSQSGSTLHPQGTWLRYAGRPLPVRAVVVQTS